jgi:hypothetical protein
MYAILLSIRLLQRNVNSPNLVKKRINPGVYTMIILTIVSRYQLYFERFNICLNNNFTIFIIMIILIKHRNAIQRI